MDEYFYLTFHGHSDDCFEFEPIGGDLPGDEILAYGEDGVLGLNS